VIAVTGGAGAGKSTAAAFFAGYGAVVLDADEYARRALEDGEVVQALRAAFGDGVVDPGGAVDRRALADAAFASPATLRKLDAATHPPIESAMLAELDALAGGDPRADTEAGPRVIVVDVPLLTAVSAVRGRCDYVVAIEAPLTSRIARLAARGLDEPDARRRIGLQPDDAHRRAVASEVVVNDGSLEQLESALAAVWARVLAHAARP
jgi:dephospho-CoA kinase